MFQFRFLCVQILFFPINRFWLNREELPFKGGQDAIKFVYYGIAGLERKNNNSLILIIVIINDTLGIWHLQWEIVDECCASRRSNDQLLELDDVVNTDNATNIADHISQQCIALILLLFVACLEGLGNLILSNNILSHLVDLILEGVVFETLDAQPNCRQLTLNVVILLDQRLVDLVE